MRTWELTKQKEIEKREKALKKSKEQLKKVVNRIANSDKTIGEREMKKIVNHATSCALYYAELMDLGARSQDGVDEDFLNEILEGIQLK